MKWLHRSACLIVLLGASLGTVRRAAAEERPPVILLVHGMAWNLEGDDRTWGRPIVDTKGRITYTEMVGHLHKQGFRYGGSIRPVGGDVGLPERLDTYGVQGDPRYARVFVLKFSPSANTDGLALKALELAEAVKQLRRFTGAEKVRLVAHSAGGLVARTYLQSALPGVPYRGDVDRLITIATPHLGSALAEHFGDYLGTRATSLKPSAALIHELNDRLELPGDCLFASIVVRGIGVDARDAGEELDQLVDDDLLAKLPVGYRLGGDEVVHVRSQNLRLAKCAARYEQATGHPVQYILARVPDPSPGEWWPSQSRIHASAPANPTVQALVAGLVHDGSLLWRKARDQQFADWIGWQARLHARGVIEAESLGIHPMSSASVVRIDALDHTRQRGATRHYAFNGKAWSENPLIPLRKRWTRVRGTLDLTFDEFGRVVAAKTNIYERQNL